MGEPRGSPGNKRAGSQPGAAGRIPPGHTTSAPLRTRRGRSARPEGARAEAIDHVLSGQA